MIKVVGAIAALLVALGIALWMGLQFVVHSQLAEADIGFESIDRSGLTWKLRGVKHPAFVADSARITVGATSRVEFSSMAIDLGAVSAQPGVAQFLGSLPSNLYLSADPLKLTWGEATLASGLRTRLDAGTLSARGPTMWVRGQIGETSELKVTGGVKRGGTTASIDVNWKLGTTASVRGDVKRVTLNDSALAAAPVVLEGFSIEVSGTAREAKGTLGFAKSTGDVSLTCDGPLGCRASLSMEKAKVGPLAAQLSEATPGFDLSSTSGEIALKIEGYFTDPTVNIGLEGAVARSKVAPLRLDDYRTYFSFEVREATGERIRLDGGPDSPDWVPNEQLPSFWPAMLVTGLGLAAKAQDKIQMPELGAAFVGRREAGADIACEAFAERFLIGRKGGALNRALRAISAGAAAKGALGVQHCTDILTNSSSFAPGVYGVANAAEHYFGVQPGELSTGQAAWLALAAAQPTRSAKQWRTHGRVDQQRFEWILDTLHAEKVISTAELELAKTSPPTRP